MSKVITGVISLFVSSAAVMPRSIAFLLTTAGIPGIPGLDTGGRISNVFEGDNAISAPTTGKFAASNGGTIS